VRSFSGFSDNEKLNMPIQGGAAEVMLIALVYCHRAVRKLGAVIVNIVHDELVIETPEAQAQSCVQAVRTAMNKAFADYCESLEVLENWEVAEVQTGAEWSCKLSHS
jgi:DNA polymerase I-like protein with 3'-5' exonuclease and polymerase domains